jgi:hypothetical protein
MTLAVLWALWFGVTLWVRARRRATPVARSAPAALDAEAERERETARPRAS